MTSQGELLLHREEDALEEGALSSDHMWVWPAEDGDCWWAEPEDDSFDAAMGYGLVTPAPEVSVPGSRALPSSPPPLSLSLSPSLQCQGRTLGSNDIDLSVSIIHTSLSSILCVCVCRMQGMLLNKLVSMTTDHTHSMLPVLWQLQWARNYFSHPSKR